jgi:hypothetical protein
MLTREIISPTPWLVRWSAGIVAGTVGLIFVAALVSRMMNLCGERRLLQIARVTTKLYAFEAYPCWRTAHPDRVCPDTLSELDEYMNNRDIRDVWGNDYVMVCPSTDSVVQPHGIIVLSAGEDGRLGTFDDISSSE